MSGLFAAAFLRQIGWDVDVYERSPVELVGRGAGITTHPELLEALDKSGAGTRDLGVVVEKRITLDRGGRVIGEKPLRQILTSWDRLQRLLRETIAANRYPLSPRIRELRAILDKLEPPTRQPEPHPAPRPPDQPSLLLAKRKGQRR